VWQVYRLLDIKLYVNDDGAVNLSRHDLDPHTGVALYERECKARGAKVLARKSGGRLWCVCVCVLERES
jgi:hypothetical protein